jgi:hypothetical protein
MQRTALRAAADAERSATATTAMNEDSSLHEDSLTTLRVRTSVQPRVRTAWQKSAYLLPACYLLVIAVLCAVGLSPIAFGVVCGAFIIVGAIMPLVTVALVSAFEAAREWNLVEPLMLGLLACNCFILNRIGAYFDR